MSRKYGRKIQDSEKSFLELAADQILADDLKNRHSNKSKTIHILSESQMARRQNKELPFSDLSKRDRLRLGIEIEGSEVE